MPKRFGNYEILKKIATGGMAEIFLAKQTSLGGFERLVVVKRILPHLNEQDEFIKMFQDEARIVANLNHPNIAQIFDIGQVNDTYYIAMEFVRGEDLRRVYNQEVARGRAMPLEPAAHITMGAAAGLDFAHRQTSISGRALGIVHRDVSPQNVLVTYDGHVKLVDFGVAKAEGKLTETRSGVLKGKYSYMSPEQASGDPIDGRTDIFALGITLYEVTTGVRLFKRETEIETLHAVIECKVTAPSELVPGYDSEMEQIVMKALAHDPDDRYPTAGEMEHDLERFLVKRGQATSASTLGAYMQDLFAEKLADELLFGGQPWEESLTPSRQAQTSRLSPGEEAGAASKGGSKSSAGRGKDGRDPEDTEVSKPTSENTFREPSGVSQRSDDSASKPVWGAPDDWVTNAESASQTATQDPRLAAPAALSPAAPGAADVDARGATPPQRRARLLPAVAVASLILGISIAVALVLTSKRRDHSALPRSGMLAIDSEPRGARVIFVGPGNEELNQRYQGHRTPFTIVEGLPVENALKIRFVKDGYEIPEVPLPELAVGVVPPPLFVQLPTGEAGAETGALVVLSDPKGADVYVDGNKVDGTTPLNDVRVRGGEMHKVEFRLRGYKPRWETVYVEPGSRRFVEVSLFPETGTSAPSTTPVKPPAATSTTAAADDNSDEDGEPDRGDGGKSFLTITSPVKLKVTVDNRYVGETPLKRLAVDSGVRRLKLVSEGEGFTLHRKVRLAAGHTEAIDIKPLKGNLAVNATPWAWVRIGKNPPAETPVRLAVYEGEYTVLFECPDGKRKKDTAKVTPGKTVSLSINCRD